MYKEIIKRYDTYKEAIIDTEFFSIEEYYQDNGYTLLADYLSFLDFSELLLLIILVRFLCSWRIILFIYLGYILCQIYFFIYFINTNYKNTTLSALPLRDYIELILSSLLIPFGSIIRSKLKKEYSIILNGGGGLFITNAIIGKRTFTKESDNLDFTNFATHYMETHKHPKISLNLVYSYTDALNKSNFDKSITLFKDCNINQKKCLMSLTNSCFSENKDTIRREKLFDNELILAQHRLFLAESNKLILDNAEEVFNIKFLIPNEKSDDLISLDSAQPFVSKPWTFESIIKEYRRNYSKMQELLDTALTQGQELSNEIVVIGSVKESGTLADYYVSIFKKQDLSRIFPVIEGRYTHSQMKDFIIWMIDLFFPKISNTSSDDFENLMKDLDKRKKHIVQNKELIKQAEDIKLYPDYQKFKKPTPKRIRFNIINGQPSYLYAGNVTGFQDNTEATKYASLRYFQADDLVKFKKMRQKDPKFKDISDEELLEYIRDYNLVNYPDTQKRGIWQYNLEDLIKASRPNCHGHPRPSYNDDDTYINIDPKEPSTSDPIITFLDKNLTRLSDDDDDLPPLEDISSYKNHPKLKEVSTSKRRRKGSNI